ncbi:hypothetical protein OTU49_006687, partial [Cherax quadricarinatus]
MSFSVKMDEMRALQRQDEATLPILQNRPLLDSADNRGSVVSLPHISQRSELKPVEENLIPLFNSKSQNVEKGSISPTDKGNCEIFPLIQEDRHPLSRLKDVEQNTVSKNLRQETAPSFLSKNVKTLDNSVNDVPVVSWRLKCTPGLLEILQSHMQWFRTLISVYCKTRGANFVEATTFADYVHLVKLEAGVAKIFSKHKNKSESIFTTEYLYSQSASYGIHTLNVCHLRDLLTQSPLFVYSAATGLWKKHYLNNDPNILNEEFHWRGILCMRHVWTASIMSQSTNSVQIASLEAVVGKSVMTDHQIFQQICYALHMPRCEEIMESMKSLLVLSSSFTIFEKGRDTAVKNNTTLADTVIANSSSSLNSSKLIYLQKEGNEKQEPCMQMLPKTIKSEDCQTMQPSCPGTEVSQDLTPTFQVTPLATSQRVVVEQNSELASHPQTEDTHQQKHKPMQVEQLGGSRKTVEKNNAPITKKKKSCITKKTCKQQNMSDHLSKILSAPQEQYLAPLLQGWVREVVRRAIAEKKRCDVYYHPPKGRKLRSRVEIVKYLTEENVTGLTIDNFTFYPFCLGFREPYEVIRSAKLCHAFKTKKKVEEERKILKKTIECVTAAMAPLQVPEKKCSTNNDKHNLKENDGFEVISAAGETTGYEDWIQLSSVPQLGAAKFNTREKNGSKKQKKVEEERKILKKTIECVTAAMAPLQVPEKKCSTNNDKHNLKENDGFEVISAAGETTGYEDWIQLSSVPQLGAAKFNTREKNGSKKQKKVEEERKILKKTIECVTAAMAPLQVPEKKCSTNNDKHNLKENDGFEVINEAGETTGYEDWIQLSSVTQLGAAKFNTREKNDSKKQVHSCKSSNKYQDLNKVKNILVHGASSNTTLDGKNKNNLMEYESNSEMFLLSTNKNSVCNDLTLARQNKPVLGVSSVLDKINSSDDKLEMGNIEIKSEPQKAKNKVNFLTKNGESKFCTNQKKAEANTQ